MSDIIQLLPDAIANQIAAGEVVQRPSSVVKELLENSIDAGADHITLHVKEAGRALIQVIDNGCGMTSTDARMSFERHATSKIRKSDDLFNIKTMGFRGEAMASIAAVAQVEVKTKTPDQEIGTIINIEGSEIKKQEPTACSEGTTTSVKNLFYNVPARRNFLKSNAVEMKHIIEEFQRVALAHQDKTFVLYQNDMELFHLNAGKLSQRIIGIFGKKYQEQLAACEAETDFVSVKGYVGRPESAKKTRGDQYFFVNKRFIKSPYLNHAVTRAFEQLIPEGSFPFFVLFMDIDPKHIDINVHPTKTEIKFDDERAVYAVIHAAVKQALGLHNFSPSLDFDIDVNFDSAAERRSSGQSIYSSSINSFSGKSTSSRESNNLKNWDKLFDSAQSEAIPKLTEEERKLQGDIRRSALNFDDFDDRDEQIEQTQAITFESKVSKNIEQQNEKFESVSVFQLHNQYLITQVKSGMMLIDQQAAHERILFEKYLLLAESGNSGCQQSLFPQTIEMNPADFSLYLDLEEEIARLGFQIDVFGKNALIIRGVPTDLADRNEKDLFEGILEQFKNYQAKLDIPVREKLARSLAKRSCLKRGKMMQKEECESLINQLFACKNPNFTPDGKTVFRLLSLEEIAQLLN
ncbi:DNA mismatch repair endonuclease MutL [Marinigracilibium pacificum]|uniref:DNA mismatch repair protein MutL n=1 Tax=Marinigracilibium pacificum TaxID=2729599 RepID=A0A848J791_9BACT|nr:DNA mismatch repair endonuclease MutL [Marinigracilibium pacificum]NMM50304.1 DNA mismatch repair endonuclease MutL [Marinigracilibium pacificum]